VPITRVLGLFVGEDFVILARVVMTQCQHVTDRQTDRHPERSYNARLFIASYHADAVTPCKNWMYHTKIRYRIN